MVSQIYFKLLYGKYTIEMHGIMKYELLKGTDINIRTKMLFRALFKKILYARRKLSNVHLLTIFLQNS